MTEDLSNYEQDLKSIREAYSRAKKMLGNIDDYYKSFETIKGAIDDNVDDLNKIFDRSEEKKVGIENSYNQANSLISKLRTDLAQVQGNVVEMQTAYEQFLSIKGKIDGTNAQIQQLLDTASSLKNDMEGQKNQANRALDNINSQLTNFQEKIKNMEDAYNSFVVIKGKIDDKDSGLESILKKVETLHVNADKIYSEIKTFRDESKSFLDQIKNNHKDSEKLKGDMVDTLQEIISKKNEAQKYIDLVTDSGFANSFHERKKELTDKIDRWNGWKWIFISFTVVLGIVLIILFSDIKDIFTNSNALGIILARLTLSSPFFFIIFFSMNQYNKDKHFAEAYAFKGASAQSIRQQSEFLLEKFPDQEKEISSCVLGIVSQIYSPIDNLGDNPKKVLKNSTNKSKLDINKIVAQIKTNKNLIKGMLNDNDIKDLIKTIKDAI